MKEVGNLVGKYKELRIRAEQILSERESEDSNLAASDLMHLIHELELHQVELELQNEELRASQRELAEIREQYAAIYEHAPAGYVTLDSMGLIARLNAAARDMLGLSKPTGGGLSDFIHRDDHRTYHTWLQEASREKGRIATGELQILKAWSDPFPAHVEVTASWDGEGRFNGWGILFTDVSERRKAENDLLESETRYRLLFESSLDGILLTSPDGRVLSANQAACTMLGRSEQEICEGGRDCVVDTSDPRLPQALEERRKTGKFCGELLFKHKDGTSFPVELSSTQISSDKGELRSHIIFRDISSRKRMEESLLESRQFLRSALDGLSANITLIDAEGAILLVNKAWRDFAEKNGVRAESVSEGRNYFQALSDAMGQELEDVDLSVEGIRSVLSGSSQSFSWEYPCHSPAEERWFIGRVTPLPGDGPRHAVIAHQDITERKRADALLRQSERRFRAIYEQAPLGIALIDSLSGGFLEVNPRYCEIVGRSKEEMLRINFQTITHPDDLEQDLDNMSMLVAGKIQRFKMQKRYVRPDASIVWVNLTVEPMWEEGQTQKRHLAIVEDITVHRQTRDALRYSEEKYRRLVESANTLIFEVSPEGIITFCNQFSLDFFGYAKDELIGANVFGTVLPQVDSAGLDLSTLLEQIALRPEEYRYNENENTLRNGERVWVAWANRALFNEQGELSGILSVGVDITARKELEGYLQIERDVAIRLGSAVSISQALESLLDACLLIKGIDSGGVYLDDAKAGELNLVHHKGLSSQFVAQAGSYGVESPQRRRIFEGIPLFLPFPTRLKGIDSLLEKEGIKVLASIPLKVDDEIIGALNLASRSLSEIPARVQILLDSFAQKLARVVTRIRTADKLLTQTELLQEANAAMRAILRQKEEDRSELEKSISENLKNLVLPYVDKLKKSRPSDHQQLYIDLLDSHIREVLTPIGKSSRISAVLTPTEMRVAELIRQEKTSKEIAEALGFSKSTADFHRKSIRQKLKLDRKTNLKSYLANHNKW